MRKSAKWIILAAVLCMFMCTGCGKKINVNDYLTVEVSGYDGYGMATIVFDSDQFEEDCEGVKYVSGAKEDGFPLELFYGDVETYLKHCFNGSFKMEPGKENGRLENGDTIVYVLDIEADSAKENTGVNLVGTDIEVKVSGLEEVGTFDAFSAVEVIFSGISPNGRAEVSNIATDEVRSQLQYTIENGSGLSNGDTVTVFVRNADNTSYMIETFGGIPEADSKDFVVSGLSAYIMSLDEISEDMDMKMEQQGIDMITAHAASSFSERETFYGVECIGKYFLTPKSPGEYSRFNNRIDYVYKVTLENTKSGGPFNYYTCISYQDIMLLSDGTISVNLTGAAKTSDIWRPSYGSFYYYGYADLDTAFNKYVTQYIGDCNYVSTVNQ